MDRADGDGDSDGDVDRYAPRTILGSQLIMALTTIAPDDEREHEASPSASVSTRRQSREERLSRVVRKCHDRTTGHVANFMRIVVRGTPVSEFVVVVDKRHTVEYVAHQIEAEYAYRFLLPPVVAVAHEALARQSIISKQPFQCGILYDHAMTPLLFQSPIGEVAEEDSVIHVANIFEQQPLLEEGLSGARDSTRPRMHDEPVMFDLEPDELMFMNRKPSIAESTLSSEAASGSMPHGPYMKRNAGIQTEATLDGRFQTYIRNKLFLDIFHVFCIDQFAIESLMFWLDVEVYRCAASLDVEAQRLYICLTYIVHGAPLEINIADEVRREILCAHEASDETNIMTVFDEAQERIFAMLKGHAFFNFEKNAHYQRFRENRARDGRAFSEAFIQMSSFAADIREIRGRIRTILQHSHPGLPHPLPDSALTMSKILWLSNTKGPLVTISGMQPIRARMLDSVLRGFFADSPSLPIEDYFRYREVISTDTRQRRVKKDKLISRFFGQRPSTEQLKRQIMSTTRGISSHPELDPPTEASATALGDEQDLTDGDSVPSPTSPQRADAAAKSPEKRLMKKRAEKLQDIFGTKLPTHQLASQRLTDAFEVPRSPSDLQAVSMSPPSILSHKSSALSIVSANSLEPAPSMAVSVPSDLDLAPKRTSTRSGGRKTSDSSAKGFAESLALKLLGQTSLPRLAGSSSLGIAFCTSHSLSTSAGKAQIPANIATQLTPGLHQAMLRSPSESSVHQIASRDLHNDETIKDWTREHRRKKMLKLQKFLGENIPESQIFEDAGRNAYRTGNISDAKASTELAGLKPKVADPALLYVHGGGSYSFDLSSTESQFNSRGSTPRYSIAWPTPVATENGGHDGGQASQQSRLSRGEAAAMAAHEKRPEVILSGADGSTVPLERISTADSHRKVIQHLQTAIKDDNYAANLLRAVVEIDGPGAVDPVYESLRSASGDLALIGDQHRATSRGKLDLDARNHSLPRKSPTAPEIRHILNNAVINDLELVILEDHASGEVDHDDLQELIEELSKIKTLLLQQAESETAVTAELAAEKRRSKPKVSVQVAKAEPKTELARAVKKTKTPRAAKVPKAPGTPKVSKTPKAPKAAKAAKTPKASKEAKQLPRAKAAKSVVAEPKLKITKTVPPSSVPDIVAGRKASTRRSPRRTAPPAAPNSAAPRSAAHIDVVEDSATTSFVGRVATWIASALGFAPL
ncbi:hypothetical protein HK105_203618 [Polyrhizophydium stewartii]|uniref:RGS domain-containing protein n=1 Tax=Polyrhizophydium stewartii TaxID=2732419 RepID=A0ABR4NBC9_9FUNG